MSSRLPQQEKEGMIGARLCLLFSLFLIMLIVVSFCQSFVNQMHIEERTRLLTVSTLQDILAFILPAFIMARTASGKPFSLLGLTHPVSGRAFLGVIILFIIGLPFLNQIVYWNESISLPDTLKGVETFFRTMEERAATTTEIILGTKTIGGMISGILIIGILTGLSEEILFRGGLQRTLYYGGWSASGAIWLSAVVFSFMHFQFFGFVPRILLGACFGYLFYWTGSLWPAVAAHALNNSLVVTSAWMMENDYISNDAGEIMVITDGFPWPALISLILLIFFFLRLRPVFFSKK